jgi:hypothetical protein
MVGITGMHSKLDKNLRGILLDPHHELAHTQDNVDNNSHPRDAIGIQGITDISIFIV